MVRQVLIRPASFPTVTTVTGIYGDELCRRVQGLGIEEVLTAPQSPWQNPCAERLLGSLRRHSAAVD